jgi:hypothetical protein
MSAIIMTIERVATRATGEVLLTLAVQPEQAALIAGFLPKIGAQIGVAFADLSGAPVVKERAEAGWNKLAPLTQTAVTFCKYEAFQQFAAERGYTANEDGARKFILEWCKVGTRKDLDTADGAKERFGALMADYREWLNNRG